MHALYLLSVYLHILAMTAWVGGMFFLVFVMVPWLRSRKGEAPITLLRDAALRFRSIGWVCFGILLVTGTFNLWVRGVRLDDFGDAAWRASPFGRAVLLKLSLFATVLLLSAWHDFRVGPRATQAMIEHPGAPETRSLRRSASVFGRVTAILGLLLVALGVVLVRGWPF